MKFIALDTTPLGLLVQPVRSPNRDRCRQWLSQKVILGDKVLVPEIADYEVRRELLRAKKHLSLRLLDDFVREPQVTFLSISSSALRRAAELWAEARNRGMPTADRHALDGDVILAAQILDAGINPADVVVATSNASHLAQFIPTAVWDTI